MSEKFPQGFSEPGTLSSPFTICQAVAWGEMDAFGHVNNTVFMRWIENVRFHYFETVGLAALGDMDGIGPILARTEIDFHAPVRFPDSVLVSTRVSRIGTKSFTMDNRIYSVAGKRECAHAIAVIVMVDYRGGGATVKLPDSVRAAIMALDGVE